MSIGFGIVGCGTISAWHAEGIRSCEGAQLIGSTDPRAAAAAAFCAQYGGTPFASYKDMLACDDICAVCICTPSGLHAEQATQAAQAGKHVLIEKPIALTVRQADAVMEAVTRNGVKAGVVSQFRFSNALIRLHDAVQSGLLGRILTADLMMKYHRSEAYFAAGGWRGTWKMDGGGALMNQGIHGIDSLLYVAGGVRHVYGIARTLRHAIEVEDTACAALEFESGALGMVQGTTSVYPGAPRRLSVSGTRGTISICEQLFTEWGIEGQSLPEDITLGGEQRTGASDPANFDVYGHAMHIDDMVRAIREDRSPIVGCEDARRAVQLICAIYESSQTGRRIDIAKE